jgi:hypothetical protein
MNRNNKLELKENNAVDIELLRIENLIEEIEDYEEEFFSMEPSNDDLDYIIKQYEQEIIKPELNYNFEEIDDILFDPFDSEDYLNQLHDEKLIRERELYEASEFLYIDDEFAFNDIFDFQITAREEEEFKERNGYDYSFKYEPEDCFYDDEYEDEMYYHLKYLRESQFAVQCECPYMDYMPNDDGICDFLDCYDYPEGPEENLCGIKYF